MGSLEEELERIDRLKNDLRAEIVVQDEKVHSESIHPCTCKYYGGGDSYGYWGPCICGSEELIVDQPRIVKPDNERRERASNKLERIYNSSQSFKVRYIADLALNKSYSESNLESEFDKVLMNYKSGLLDLRGAAESDLRTMYEIAKSKEFRRKVGQTLLGMSDILILANEVIRHYYGTGRLTEEELKAVYNSDENISKEVIEMAGWTLGYSGLRISLHLLKRRLSK